MGRKRSRVLWCSAALVWGVAAVSVWAWTTHYGFTTYAAADAHPLQRWPTDSSLAPAEDRPTLLFFLHPRCPCTRASISELERLLTGGGLSQPQLPKLIVVATVPPDASAEWRDADTVRRAAELPHAELVWDAGGDESSRFGVVTSGAVRLYGQHGELLFAGGVTASRGHEGDNAGSDRLRLLLSQRSRIRQQPTPAFGCRLCVDDAASACGKGRGPDSSGPDSFGPDSSGPDSSGPDSSGAVASAEGASQ